MLFLRQIAILIFILCFNAGYTQTWGQLETEYNDYGLNGRYADALIVARKMEAYASKHKSDTSSSLAKSYFYQAVVFDYGIIQYDSASNYYQKYADELANQSSLLVSKGNNKLAKVFLTELLEFLKSLKWNNDWFYCENTRLLANIHIENNEISKSEELLLETIGIYRKNNEKSVYYSSTLIAYSRLLGSKSNYFLQEIKLKECLSILEYLNLKSHPNYSNALNDLGVLYIELGKIEECKSILSKNLSISKLEFGIYSKSYASALQNLGNFYVSVGDFHNGGVLLLESYLLITKLYDKEDQVYISATNSLGNYYHSKEDYFNAEKYYFKSLELRKNKFGISSLEYATLLNNLGTLYFDLGNITSAEKYFIQALNISKKITGSNSKSYAKYLANLSLVYDKKGAFNISLKNKLEALNIYKNIYGLNHSSYALQLNNIAQTYFNKGDLIKAEYYSIEALNTYKNIYGVKSLPYALVLNNLALIYQNLNNYNKSESGFSTALQIRKEKLGLKNSIYTSSLFNLSVFYKKINKYAKASPLYNEIYNSKSEYIIDNFQFLNSNERDLFWKKEEHYFNHIIDFSSKAFKELPNSSELAYNSSLVTKALLMEASIDFNTTFKNFGDTTLINIYQALKGIRNFNAKLNSEGSDKQELIARLEHQADSLDQLLSRKMSSYKNYKNNFSLTWKDLQSSLDDDDAAIEFARYYNDSDSAYHYMGLIVRKGDKYPQLIKLCSEDELKRLSPEKELNELYNLVWKPLLPSLTNVKTIYYSPSGLLNNIPFQALYKEVNGQREYVMDKYSIHQLTSTRYLALDLKKKEQEPIQTSIALFGGINYNDYPNALADTTNYNQSTEAAFLYKNAIVLNRELDSTRTGASYLPGTKKEVETIANVLNAKRWQVDVSEGKNATENKIKSFSGNKSKAILHIATHGFAFPDKEEKRKGMELRMMNGNDKYKALDNPMIRCGLLFGGANLTWQGKGDSLLNITNEDGVLTAYELSQLDLSNTKLAVLSACETGKGAIQGSEGTFGLKRALKLAGVDNMILSLWKVPDDATMEMMTIFYTELAKSKKPVLAFELAQKTMRNKYPNEPKKWAGFVFVR